MKRVKQIVMMAFASLLAQCVWAASWSGDLQSTATDVFAGSKITFADFKAAMPAQGENAFPIVQGALGGGWMDSTKPFTAALVKTAADDQVVIQYQLIDSRWVKLAEVTFSAASDNGISAIRSNRGSIENRLTEYGSLITSFDSNNSQAANVYTVKNVTIVLPKEAVAFDTTLTGKTTPTIAVPVSSISANTGFAGNSDYYQSLNAADGSAVIKVTGSSSKKNIWGGYDTGSGAGTLTNDTWLNITGGEFAIVGGGSWCNWGGGNKVRTGGNVVVEVSGGTIDHIVGGNHQEGGGSAAPQWTGNTTVVVKGDAVVKGAIIGAGTVAHTRTATFTGNTKVIVKNVQSDNTASSMEGSSTDYSDYIAGGGAYASNTNSKIGITGNTAVEIDIPSEKSGNFVKNIVGGGLITTGGDYHNNGVHSKVTGNSSVSIFAPSTVKFTGTIVAGGYKENDCAGDATVSGTATLTLQGGDFSAATLKGGIATGSKTLAITGAVTLAPSQFSGFDTIVAREGGALTLNIASDVAMDNISTEGTGYIVKAGEGVLTLGHLRPRMDVQTGTIKLSATADEITAHKLVLAVPANASAAEGAKVIVLDAKGEEIELDGEPVLDTTAGTVTLNLQVNKAITASGNLSDSISESTTGLVLVKGTTEGDPIVVTIDRATPDGVTYQVSGNVKFVVADGQSMIDLSKFACDEGAEIIVDQTCTGSITVPAGVTVVLADGSSCTVVNNGTVKTEGTVSVTLTNNDSGVFDVVSGNASVDAPANQAVKGTIYVRSGAVFTNVRTSDAIAYGGTINVHVYGTLAFGSTRWTLGANNSLYLYTGANVTGAGQGGDGALDFNGGNGNIFVKPNGSTTGTVTCSAPMRNRQGGTVNVDANMTFETTGNLINYSNGSPTKAGAGTWVVKGGTYSSGATVNAGTLKLVGINPGNTITMGDGTLELAQNANGDAFTFTGTVASSSLGKGAIKTAGSTVTLSGTFTNYSGDINSSAANSKFIIPEGQEVTVGWIVSGSAIEIEGMLVHTNKATNAYTNYQGQNLRNLTGHGTFKITGPHYFFTCGTSNLANYWASTLAVWNDRGDSTIADNKGMIFGQPNNANATITIGTLSGAGLIRSDANSGDRSIKVLQAKDSEWSGAFNAGDRVKAFIVAGADGATAKTLTLSGTQTHTNDLTIEGTGSVKLTGTWKAGTVTVNGRLEVFDTATLTKTTLTSAGSMKTADSTVYFGSDEIASAEAAAKAGATYYATISDAVAAATLADITVINASAEVPAGYAKVTTGDVVTLRQVGGKVYYKEGDWKDGCTVWADAGHTSTTTFNVADTMVLDTNNTVVYPNKDITSALKIEIVAGITAVIGHDNYLTANPYNVPDNSVITLGDGAHLGVTFWNNTTDHTPAFGTVTINGGTFGVYNVTSKAINAGTIKGTSQLVLNEGETITVSGSIETTPISGVATKRVVTTLVTGGTKYSLETIQPEPPTPTEGGITPSIPGADTIVIVDAEGETVSGGKIPLATGVYTVTGKVGETVVATETIAVVKTKDAESGSSPDPVTTAVAVPFTGATVANLLNTALLTPASEDYAGDELKALNPETQNYQSWKLVADAETGAKSWSPITTVRAGAIEDASDPATTTLARGAAVWVTTAGKVVAFGAYEDSAVEPVVVSGYNLIGNPMMTAITPAAKTVGDVLIPVGGTELVRYKVIDKGNGTKAWKCHKSVSVAIPGLEDVSGSQEVVTDDEPTVEVGGSVWLIK